MGCYQVIFCDFTEEKIMFSYIIQLLQFMQKSKENHLCKKQDVIC